MLNSSNFYFSTIRNLTAAFGSLFNNIRVVRYNQDGSVATTIKVPLGYASADKTITMLQQQDVQRRENFVDVKIILPRLSFELTSISYDSSRKQQTIGKNIYVPPSNLTFNAATAVNVADNTIAIPSHNLRTGQSVNYSMGSGTVIGSTGISNNGTYYAIKVNNNTIKLASTKSLAEAGTALDITSVGSGTASLSSSYSGQYNPVPYNFEFTVNLFVKYIDDGLQIIEQILPYFTPFYTITMNDIPSLDMKRDVQVTLTSVSQSDEYEGAVEDDRIITWTLTFVANSWIYPPISDSKIIKTAVTNFYELDTTQKLVTTTVSVNPSTADRDDVYTIDTTITEY
jgi:T4-like virus Myoviridae tail sheath stabiliser